MKENFLKKLQAIFRSYPQIKLVYFFGSRAQEKEGPLSDYDFAFYLDEKDKKKISEIQFELMDKISRILKTDKIDVVMLNLVESPELKYNIIKEGKLIYEKPPFKVLIEPKILQEFFDFKIMLKKYNLTQD